MTEEKNETKKESQTEVLVDFEGTQNQENKKTLVRNSVYSAEFASCSLVEVPKYEGKEGEKSKKLLFYIKLLDVVGMPEVPLYANPTIKKSGGQKGYSNSKLYDLLVDSGELDNAMRAREEISSFEGVEKFFQGLVGRKCSILTKTSNKGTDKAYSVVDKIVEFVEA